MATVITWVFQSCCCCCAEKAVCVRRSSSTAEFQKSSWQIAGRTPTGTFATYTFTSSQNFYSFHHFAGEKTCWKKPVINALRRVLKCHLKKIEQQWIINHQTFPATTPKAKQTICPSIQFLCDRNPDDKLKKSWRLINCKCDTLAQVQFELGPFHHTTLCLVMIFLQQKKFLNSFLVFATTWKCFTSF